MMTTHASPSYAKLRGKISKLRKHGTKVNPLAGSIEHKTAGLSAVVQAALGLPGAVPTAAFADYDGDPVEAFAMEVDGQQVYGYFWNVSFCEGDEVDVVGTSHSSAFEAVAVLKTESRLIWLRPHYATGTKAQKRNDLTRILKVGSLGWLGAIPFVSIVFSNGINSETPSLLLSAFACVAGVYAICLFVLRTPGALDFASHVDAIGRAMGLEDPQHVDFNARNTAARKSGKPYVRGAQYY